MTAVTDTEEIKNVKTAWRAACWRAGMEGLNFHDLRHEFTSSMLDAGVPVHKIRDWVGHKNVATTSIHANTTLSHLQDALTTFERRTGTRPAQTPGGLAFSAVAGGLPNPPKRC
jgi:integrase